jgi:hypothetical protein
MIKYMFKDLMKSWDKAAWIESWSIVGDVRDLCEKNVGRENGHWHFIDVDGNKTTALPHGIVFYEDCDATRFKLVL